MRKTYLLIEAPNGERMLVRSLAGHEDCRVVNDRVPEPPNDHCRLCPKGKWIEDEAAKEEARLARMSRGELIAEVLRRAKET